MVVDMRNQYESAVGHFAGAICPAVETFKEELPQVAAMLKGKEADPVLLYCTGGIRCEKASAYLKAKGFAEVLQLSGGIVQYAQTIRQSSGDGASDGLVNHFIGKNFVFDGRMERGERISAEVIGRCGAKTQES
eukprot:SAG31_NODE_12870_length_910_cov_1.138101_1_plen_134_part_00